MSDKPEGDEEGSESPRTPDEIRQLARSLRQSAASVLLESAEIRRMAGPDLKTLDAKLDLRLKKIYAYGLLGMMALQLVLVNGVVLGYAVWGVDWEIEPSVMHVWLVSTLVEIIGIIYVVTKYLFPNRDAGR